MDWIEQQHHAEELLSLTRERKWSHLCATIRHCIDSYNRLYAGSVGAVATCSEEGDSVKWKSKKTTDQRTVELHFSPAEGVEVIYNKNLPGAATERKRFTVVIEDQPVWKSDKKSGQKTFPNEDEVSRAILKQVLFPDHA